MPRRRKRARFEQLTEFERGRIIGLREAGLSYRAVASRVQRNSSTVMRVWKQWTDECRTTRKSGSGPRNVTSARDDRHLVRMARTDRTASSRQLAALWSIATGVSLCASSIRRRLLQCGLRARTPLYRIPLTHDHRRLRLQWANQHRDWRADWQHVVFSDESRFNLWYHDGRIRVRRYAGERHLPECIIERHSGRTPGVMVWGAIAYHRRSQLLRIVGNLNSNRYIREVLQPEAVPFLQSLPGAVFQQDNARPHTARIVKSFFAAQQVQLLPWPACSPDMSPIEHVWDVIGRRLARDPRPVASADELWWARQHVHWTSDQWRAVLFTGEFGFSLESDSRHYWIWGEPGTHYHPSNIRERDAYGRGSVCVWGGIALGACTDLRVFPRRTVIQVYRDDILDAYVYPYAGAMGDAFLLHDDNSRPHRARIVDDYLQQETIMRMEWPVRSPHLNPIEHVWDALGRRLAALNPPPQTTSALATALQEQWLSLPMELIDRIIESNTDRCMCFIASRGDHIRY
ncbi:Transposable element Tc1 transposase, partial [Stegodyphus mimosarum]